MIYEVKLKSIEEVLNAADKFPAFAFRGQSTYEWDLSTTLERLGSRYDYSPDYLDNREFWILTQFRRRAHNLIEKPPPYEELIEWLAILQHYGGPTRFLDFTKSFYLGLFFACEETVKDAALWMIDLHALLETHAPEDVKKDTVYHKQRAILNLAKGYIGTKTSASGLLPIEPERLNERMSIQQGLSIMPININKGFMENLQKEYNWDKITYKQVPLEEVLKNLYTEHAPRVIKVHINTQWIPKILHLLNDMNINTNTLFPGLDGFARSFNLHLIPPKF